MAAAAWNYSIQRTEDWNLGRYGMEISYKRDLARSFMCIVSDEEWDSFEEECLQKGRIEGFLPIRVTRENGRTVCWYDITGRQALDRR